MPAGPNMNCPHCNGRLHETDDHEHYACQQCGRELHQVVVDNLDTFESLADRDTPAAKIAEAALEGREGQQ